MSSLPAHVAAANAKQGREWRENQAARNIHRMFDVDQGTIVEAAAEELLEDHRPADLLSALRTVSGEEEFGQEPGRGWLKMVTEAVEDLIAEEPMP